MEPDERILTEFTFSDEEGEAHLVITNRRLRIDVPILSDPDGLMEEGTMDVDIGGEAGKHIAKKLVKRIDRWLLSGIPLENIRSFRYENGKMHLKGKFIRFLPAFDADFELPEDVGTALVAALAEAMESQ